MPHGGEPEELTEWTHAPKTTLLMVVVGFEEKVVVSDMRDGGCGAVVTRGHEGHVTWTTSFFWTSEVLSCT